MRIIVKNSVPSVHIVDVIGKRDWGANFYFRPF